MTSPSGSSEVEVAFDPNDDFEDALKEVLNRLDGKLVHDDDGSARFEHGVRDLGIARALAARYFQLLVDIPEWEKGRLINDAIFRAAEPGPLTLSSLKKEVGEKISEYQSG
ncbi:MAG: hypothetical protein ABEN55_03590, partial [Bradymonadaceae bacterium]